MRKFNLIVELEESGAKDLMLEQEMNDSLKECKSNTEKSDWRDEERRLEKDTTIIFISCFFPHFPVISLPSWQAERNHFLEIRMKHNVSTFNIFSWLSTQCLWSPRSTLCLKSYFVWVTASPRLGTPMNESIAGQSKTTWGKAVRRFSATGRKPKCGPSPSLQG